MPCRSATVWPLYLTTSYAFTNTSKYSLWVTELRALGAKSVIRLHHYNGEDYCFCHYFYYYYTFPLFFSDFHQTSQVGTLGGPYYTDPFLLTLTYFSRSQTHFCQVTKFKIVITLLFLGQTSQGWTLGRRHLWKSIHVQHASSLGAGRRGSSNTSLEPARRAEENAFYRMSLALSKREIGVSRVSILH